LNGLAVSKQRDARGSGAVKRRRKPRVPHQDPAISEFTEVLVARNQDEARTAARGAPNRLVVVERGQPRSLVLMCPCGCEDVLVINLDPAAGDAWRLRRRSDLVTLLPSVWRTSGCKSHFILYNNHIWWCRRRPEDDEEPWPEEMDAELRDEWRRVRTGGGRPSAGGS
jgi:uncharacterized protein DUF6527